MARHSSRVSWLLGVLLFNLTIAALAAEPEAEPRAAETITAFGEEIDPDGDCGLTEENGTATLTIPGTWHDLTHTEEYDRVNAPRLVNNARGDFSLTVKVAPFKLPKENDSSGGRYAFRSAGAVLWQDDDNFIRFERASVSRGAFAFIEHFARGRSVAQHHVEIPQSATWLRATRTGDQFQFEVSDDGQDWNPMQSFEAELANRLKVGVHAINTTNEEFSATFSDYQLEP